MSSPEPFIRNFPEDVYKILFLFNELNKKDIMNKYLSYILVMILSIVSIFFVHEYKWLLGLTIGLLSAFCYYLGYYTKKDD